MSQYPSPYSPPPYPQNAGYYNPYAFDPLRPAKRAGILMIIVGAIAILFATCMVGVGQMIRTVELPPELAAQLQQWESKGVSPEAVFTAMGVAFLLFAVTQILLGLFVRRGKTFAIVFSLTGTSLVVVLLGLFVLSGAVNVLTHASPQMLVGLMVWIVPLGLLVLQLIWLIAALRGRRQVAFAQQQYQAQYWQYQQNMQGYSGYGQAPPPPPPLPQNPPENAGK
jgi:hypothetical protein